MIIILGSVLSILISINFYTIKTGGFVDSAADILQKEFKNNQQENRLRNEQGRICHGIPEI